MSGRLLDLLWDALAWLAVQGIERLLWPLLDTRAAVLAP